MLCTDPDWLILDWLILGIFGWINIGYGYRSDPKQGLRLRLLRKRICYVQICEWDVSSLCCLKYRSERISPLGQEKISCGTLTLLASAALQCRRWSVVTSATRGAATWPAQQGARHQLLIRRDRSRQVVRLSQCSAFAYRWKLVLKCFLIFSMWIKNLDWVHLCTVSLPAMVNFTIWVFLGPGSAS